jgi:uncharacterized protein YcbX
MVSALGTVATLRRYPVKSMLGEDLAAAEVTAAGFAGDRTIALVDVETGRVASAKHPKSWRGLLSLRTHWDNGSARITLPDGVTLDADDDDASDVLSALLRREVRLTTARPEHAEVARPAPEDVLAGGEDADVPYELLEIGQGTPGATFVDYAPVHVVTSATLAHVGVEAVRYRPNIVLDTPGGVPFAENDWLGREIAVGGVRLRGILPTPRCAIPTLAHGDLPSRPEAVRTLLSANRVDVPGFGYLPCLGAYAEVLEPGTIRIADRATIT